MSNMHYCRFVNTYHDLMECFDGWEDDVSPEEERYRDKLLALCKRIVDALVDDEEAPDEVPGV